ncbi:MAG: anhydro-N-acetylmuramic acid kinase [Xanthomonadales bacterium]|nr:anhydro-N-acetylmuramic acid kinase [Xanthomonadales bacterium]
MPAGSSEALYLGMISGTSRDGVDAALVGFPDHGAELLHAICMPYPPALRNDVDTIIAAGCQPSAGRAASLDESLGRFFARVANELIQQVGIERRDVAAIGSHGQTVWHEPGGERPVSVQLGSGSMISRATGITTIADFRRADLVAGGQGAPLAPLLHRVLLASGSERRAVINIGGIANLTFLRGRDIAAGFDTGPGNCLMDAWIHKHSDQPFDRDGAWAAGGQPEPQLLEDMLSEPFFHTAPPKSTGLELFNMGWLQRHLAGRSVAAVAVQATLAELTARTIADALCGLDTDRVLLCGGGVHNRHLVDLLSSQLAPVPVETTSAHGVDPDWVEAILFAWLARERLAGRTQDTAPVTGARKPVLLGRVFGLEA